MKKHLVWLDMAKGLAILLVVLGHCLDPSVGPRDFIYSFHMPLFFVLAGFTMHAKARLTVLRSSALRLLVPYAIVCAVLLFFAFFPPDSFNSALDSQRSPKVVLGEIIYGSGDTGRFLGHTFQAIGAIWFLPCLFVARLMLNEILLLSQRLKERSNYAALAAEIVSVALLLVCGFIIGNITRLPFDVDTAFIATFFMYVGYRVKLFDMSKIHLLVFVALFIVWMLYPLAGDNEMAVRAYLDHPASLITATAGSLVIMRLMMLLERVPVLDKALAWCGVQSMVILCVHRLESAIFNWQSIMEFFIPQVWDWALVPQGFYQFGLRITLVLFCSIIFVVVKKRLGLLLKPCSSEENR